MGTAPEEIYAAKNADKVRSGRLQKPEQQVAHGYKARVTTTVCVPTAGAYGSLTVVSSSVRKAPASNPAKIATSHSAVSPLALDSETASTTTAHTTALRASVCQMGILGTAKREAGFSRSAAQAACLPRAERP